MPPPHASLLPPEEEIWRDAHKNSNHYKNKTVEMLLKAGIAVHVYGESWDESDMRPDKLHIIAIRRQHAQAARHLLQMFLHPNRMVQHKMVLGIFCI